MTTRRSRSNRGGSKRATDDGSERRDATGGVDPAIAAFASFIKAEEKQEKEARRAAKQARAAEEEANRLVAAKDEAAAELKRLRGRSGVPPEVRAAAEEAYRSALAAVVAAETGSTPEWAPATAATDGGPDVGSDDATTDEAGDSEAPVSDAADEPSPDEVAPEA